MEKLRMGCVRLGTGMADTIDYLDRRWGWKTRLISDLLRAYPHKTQREIAELFESGTGVKLPENYVAKVKHSLRREVGATAPRPRKAIKPEDRLPAEALTRFLTVLGRVSAKVDELLTGAEEIDPLVQAAGGWTAYRQCLEIVARLDINRPE